MTKKPRRIAIGKQLGELIDQAIGVRTSPDSGEDEIGEAETGQLSGD